MIAFGVLALGCALALCVAGPVLARRSERGLMAGLLIAVLGLGWMAGLLLAPGGAP